MFGTPFSHNILVEVAAVLVINSFTTKPSDGITRAQKLCPKAPTTGKATSTLYGCHEPEGDGARCVGGEPRDS